MATIDEIKRILAETLQIGDKADSFDHETALLGSIPEFDSMAVVTVITAIEDEFGIVVDDDEVDAETFETVGTLVAFVENRV